MAEILTDFPDATNTGVRDGVTLTPVSGQFSTSFDGQVIEGIDVDTIVINHDGVTVRDCRVGRIFVGNAQSNVVTDTTIEYTDVTGNNGLGGIDIAGDNTTVRFCDISGCENGIWLEADGVLIEENYIHDLSNPGNPDPHIDGIQIPGTSIGALPTENVIIRHNNIDLDVRTASACIAMTDAINVDIIDNRLNAGSYVLYFYGATNDCDILNNTFNEYAFGYVEGDAVQNQTFIGNRDEATGALLPINDDGAAIAGSISINNVTISEGDSGTKVATFTATRSGGMAAFDVNFATSNATATVADSDYVAATNTLHFGANQNTQTISVTVNGDTKVEGNETFNVVLSNATNGATISDSQGIGTITNDDGAAIAGSISINDVTISEGNSGTKVATFTVTRSGGTAAFDVSFATSNGTATVADGDYVAATNTLHFGANQNTQTVSVTVNGDTKVEGNETFNVALSNATNGATISDSQGIGTITNDDGATAQNLVVNGGFESGNFSGWTLSGNSGGNQIYIAPTTFPGEVHTGSYSAGLGSFDRTDGILTQSIATTAGQHYTLSFWIESDNEGSTPINHFAAEWNGQTLMAMTDAPNSGYQLYTFDVVGINGNSVLEFAGYNSPDAWRLDDVTLTAVGVAPPATGSVSINDVTISEGNSGTKVATFTVTRSGGTAAFDVSFATSNGTATVADGDYVAATNTLHFGANQNTQTVSVTVNGDTKVEGNETFNVALSNATNGATISDSQGIGTITNDDGATAQNLVVNGGFESGNFSGWTLSGNSGGNQIYIAPTTFPGEVHTGSYSAGLGSFDRTDGILTQSIATTAGQHYTLSFWIESDNEGSTPINHFAAEWNGQTLMAMTDAPNSGYQLYTFDVVGINGNSVLEFAGYNSPDAWRLDDVTLTAVGVAPPATGSVSINDVTISEGNSGTKVATFTVTRSGGTAAFDVSFATSNGTATVADGDYVAATNTLHFGANQNTQTVSVTVNGDTKVEGNETFNVALSNATNGATISDSQGIGTITNDDGEAPPIFSDAADTVTLPSLGGTFDALGGDDKLFYTGGWVTIDGGAGRDTIDFSQFGSAVRVSEGSNSAELWALDSGIWEAIGTLSGVQNFVGTSYGDVLQGTRNDNVIEGAGGNDTLTGSDGNDTFVFGAASGRDTITDFDDWGNDVIAVSTAVFADLAALEEALIDAGSDVLIAIDAENSITLTNTSFASVTEADFLFA